MTALPALAVRDLSVHYPRHDREPLRVLDAVSLTLEPGGALVLLGESGSGKTTLARSVLGLPGRSARTSGRIELAGTDLLALDERALRNIRGRRVGYVHQDPTAALDPLRRVGTQLAEVLLRHGVVDGRRAARDAVPEHLERSGIARPAQTARRYPHELSGGERQRAAIAIAACCSPELLVADEPTSALDALVRSHVLDLFGTLRAELGVALLLVTHDLWTAHHVGGAVAVMSAGRIVDTGSVDAVLARLDRGPDVRRADTSLEQPALPPHASEAS